MGITSLSHKQLHAWIRRMNFDQRNCKKPLSRPIHLFITITLMGGLSKPWILVRSWRKVFREPDNYPTFRRTECEEGILWLRWQRRYFFIHPLKRISYQMSTFMSSDCRSHLISYIFKHETRSSDIAFNSLKRYYPWGMIQRPSLLDEQKTWLS